MTGDLTVSGDDITMGTNTAGHLLIADGTNFNPTAVGDLSEISTVANDDVFLAIDTSGGGLKKITRSTIVSGLAVSGTGIDNIVEDTTPQLGGDLDVNGNDITGSAITLDSAGDIILDADGTDITLKDGGTTFGNFKNSSGELVIQSGSTPTTAMTFSGANVTLAGNLTVSGTTTTVNSTTVTLDDHNIVLDSNNSGSAVVNGAGITLEGGSGDDATFTYNTTGPKFELKLGSNHEDLQVDQLIAASLDISGNVDVDGTLETDALSIASTTVTATAAELNIMDGVTATTAELNIMDGVTATTAELNILDGATVVVGEINALDLGSTAVGTAIASKAVILDSNKDYTGIRNFTITGELDAATLDISGDADIDGTLEADAITVNGTALDEFISDTTGAMFSSNTETGVTVTYQDSDNTIDVAIDAAQTTITSLLATDIKIGEDDQTKIDFETADEIHFYAANAEQVFVSDGVFGPQTDSDVDLGTTGVRFKDAYVDSVTVTGDVAIGDDVTVTGRASGTVTTNTNGQMDLAVSNYFNYTPSADDEIELDNFKAGQSGTIFLDNSGGHAITVDHTILINATQLTAIQTAGKYMLSYFCTVDQPNATLSNSANADKIIMSVSGALT